MMFRALSVSALAFAVGLVVVPRLSAQSAPQRFVCEDGTVSSSSLGAWACLHHGGVDQQATLSAQRGGYGVYGNTGVNGTSGNRGVYDGTANGSNRSVYNGGVANGSTRSVYDRDGNRSSNANGNHRWDRDRDRDHVRAERRNGEDNRRAPSSHGRDEADRRR